MSSSRTKKIAGEESRVPAAWSLELEDIYRRLETSGEGLTEEEAEERLSEYGTNNLGRRSKTPVLRLIGRQFASPLIFVLIFASVITTILREPVDTTVILLAILVNAALGFYQEYKAEDALERLTSYIKDRARVVRGGKEHEVDSSDLVPGDIVRLSFGARTPADVRIISANTLTADEAILTGESLPVAKECSVLAADTQVADRTNMLFAGSLVVEGHATGVVVATGASTELGRIAVLVSETKREPTPLQVSLARLAWVIFAVTTVIVAGIFFLGLSRGEPLLDMLLLSVAVAVGSIPEALPISLTVILAVGVERIAKRKGIMRSLAAAETLGSTTLVMTDKTGTLTQAKMELTAIVTTEELLSRTPRERANAMTHLSDSEKRILGGALIATDVVIENSDDPFDSWRLIGRPIETNIAKAAHHAGIDVVGLSGDRRVSVIPFSSAHKFSVSYDTQTRELFVMGAPDILLARSNVKEADRAHIESEIHRISDEGKRVLGVGILKVPHTGDVPALSVGDVEGIELIGMLLLYDPVRSEVRGALEKIISYGVRVVMVTGDLKGTARAIAREIGWNVLPENILTGADIAGMNDDELRNRLGEVEIFARVTPEDKLRIGRLFQERGEVVAMTGDGVNDAPSLRAVDIGIALGSGSDVAKGVADLVLLDDNFNTIAHAVEEGRRIIGNIRKTFVYLISSSLDEVILVGGGLIVGLPLPLTALQIIWVNFFTGSLPALSFAFEKGEPATSRSGRGNRHIFDKNIQLLTIAIGSITSLALFFFYWWLATSGFGIDLARSILFACFAAYILAITFSFKDLRRPLFSYKLFDNVPLVVSIFVALGLLLISFAVPFLRDVLGIIPIPSSYLFIVVLWLIANICLVEAIKWVFRRLGRV